MDPFSQPPTLPVSVVIEEPPRKRRRGLLIAICAVAALLIGGVGFALNHGEEQPTYSLSASSQATADATSMAFEMRMTVGGQEVTGDVEIDIVTGVMHFTMGAGLRNLEMIMDSSTGAMYISRSFFEAMGLPIETDWVKADDGSAGDGDAPVFNPDIGGDPFGATEAIGDALGTEDLGFDEVNGIKVKHYRVTFDGEDVFSWNEQLRTILEESGAEMPAEVVYDYYVDENNILRRISYVVAFGADEVNADMVITSINEPLTIEIPDDADVTDWDSLI